MSLSLEDGTTVGDKRIRVLHIGDNSGYALLVRKLLSEVSGASFELQDAQSLPAALERPAVDSTDVVLPGVSPPASHSISTPKHRRCPSS